VQTGRGVPKVKVVPKGSLITFARPIWRPSNATWGTRMRSCRNCSPKLHKAANGHEASGPRHSRVPDWHQESSTSDCHVLRTGRSACCRLSLIAGHLRSTPKGCAKSFVLGQRLLFRMLCNPWILETSWIGTKAPISFSTRYFLAGLEERVLRSPSTPFSVTPKSVKRSDCPQTLHRMRDKKFE
jgi:hypothetical protein